jgi:hypothetical protein
MPHSHSNALSPRGHEGLWSPQTDSDAENPRIFVAQEFKRDRDVRMRIHSPQPGRFFARLPAIPAGRKPLIAFILGLLFGPFVAIYLRSWFDFFAIVAAIFAVTVLLVALDATAAANAVPVLWGLWAMARVKHSRTRESGTVAEA